MESDTVPTPSYLRDSVKEIGIGSISGAIGKVIEFPFDTIKVRLQYSQSLDEPLFKNTLDCIRKTHNNEGIINGFYKGLASPVVGAALEFASLFWSYGLAKSLISQTTGSKDLEMKHKVVAGGISGAITSFILTPVELVKCQMQVRNLNSDASTSLTQMLRLIYRQDNYGLKNFWRGQSSTLFRETGGTMFWFGTYEYALLYFQRRSQRDDNSAWELLVSGASAGITYNLSFFPFDTIKSVMQTTEEKSYSKIIKKIYKSGGVRKFYAGCGITVIRAIPSNAAVFYIYETLKKQIN